MKKNIKITIPKNRADIEMKLKMNLILIRVEKINIKIYEEELYKELWLLFCIINYYFIINL